MHSKKVLRTTIDLPEAILREAKILAARRNTSVKDLVIKGLQSVFAEAEQQSPHTEALKRLRKGLHLGGKPLSRKAIHER